MNAARSRVARLRRCRFPAGKRGKSVRGPQGKEAGKPSPYSCAERKVRPYVAVTLRWTNEQNVWDVSRMAAKLEQLLEIAARTEGIEEGEVSLTFVDDEAIRELNREYRGLDKPTDVLSFPMYDADEWERDDAAAEAGAEQEAADAVPLADDTAASEDDPFPELLGDIVISVPTALRQSEEYGHTPEREIGFLFVHGFLHLIGYDHMDEASERDMFSRQERILREAGLVR